MRQKLQFNWQQYLQQNRPDIKINNFKVWCFRNRDKKSIFDTEQELLEAILLYDNNRKVCSEFDWQQYLQGNRPDISINSFKYWCNHNRPKKQIFNTEQELQEAILLYDKRQRRKSKFDWQQYLQENRQDISIVSFARWCNDSRTKKSVFDTEQEMLEALQLYDNKENKNKVSNFKWQQYLKYNRSDIIIINFEAWCQHNRPKKCIFNTKQEFLETLQLYDNRKNKRSDFRWQQYLEENRPDININSFKTWCIKNRQRKSVFDTEQELLQAISLYDVRVVKSQFKWKQYIEYNRPDINIYNFTTWCIKNRPKKSLFDTEQELIETISRYKLCTKYIVQKTKYQGIYNLIERETGLRFNFYKLEDMEGLL